MLVVLVFGAKLLSNGLCWRDGDGRLISFWTDKWVDVGPLICKSRYPYATGFNLKVLD